MRILSLLIFFTGFTLGVMAQSPVCTTWTFREQITSAAASEKPVSILQLVRGNFIVAGTDSSAVDVRGRILKLDVQGNVLLSRTISFPNAELRIRKARQFTDGRIYAIGTRTNKPSGISAPMLLEFDTATLALLSSTLLDPGTGNGNWDAVDLKEGRDKSLITLSTNGQLLNITRINYATDLITWSRSYQPQLTPRPIGLAVEYSDVYVSWNETEGGLGVAVMLDLHFDDGTFRFGSRTGGSTDGFGFELQDMQCVSLRPKITGLFTENGRHQAMRLNYTPSGMPNTIETFAIAGFVASPGMRSIQNDWEQTVAFQAAGDGLNVHYVGTYPDNYQTAVSAFRMTYPVPQEIRAIVMANDGGDVTLANTVGGLQEILLTKTDSVGTLPGCAPVAEAATFDRFTRPYVERQVPASPLTMQLVNLTGNQGLQPVNVNTQCRALFCPDPPMPDSCLRTYFLEYRNSLNILFTRTGLLAGNGKIMLHSEARTLAYDASTVMTHLSLIDTSGKVSGSASLTSGRDPYFDKIISLRDGNFLGVGMLGRPGSGSGNMYAAKFDRSFNIIWQKEYQVSSGPTYQIIREAVESAEGDIFFYLVDTRGIPNATRTLFKVSAAGLPVWIREYDLGPAIFANSSQLNHSLLEVGNDIVMYYNFEADQSPVLMRVSKTNATVSWIRKLQMDGPFWGGNSFSLRSITTDGNFIFIAGFTQDRAVLIKVNPDGSTGVARRTPNPAPSGFRYITVGPNGNLYVSAFPVTSNWNVNGLIEMDKDFNALRTQFMRIDKGSFNATLMVQGDSVVYSTGSLYDENPYWAGTYLQKYNFNSSFASCEVSDFDFRTELYTQPSVPSTNTVSTPPMPVAVDHNAVFIPGNIAYSGYRCGNNNVCTDIRLDGQESLCDSSLVFDYKVIRNPGCSGIAVWRMDTLAGQITVISVDDTLLRLKLMKAGEFKIHVKSFASCEWLEDSILVTGSIRNAVLNLGADTALCPGNNFTLHAGPDFASYTWQDGSTDSLFITTGPGTYYVDVTGCGVLYSDTFHITPLQPPPFSVGPDRTKCNSDTLRLAAPAGFQDYQWGNNYQISALNTRMVVVNPSQDTSYFVRADNGQGCVVSDTIRISVRNSPPIQLGSDTSFCKGESVVLDAGSGFSTYLWSTGQTVSSVLVNMSGSFRVKATTAEGCSSYDTISILNLYPLPVAGLTRNPVLCYGQPATLSASTGFSSYTWNTGSAASSIQVNLPGTYIVSVTDNNGCRSTDSATILSFRPSPSKFLGADTAICSYGVVLLTPAKTFSSYNWSTGSGNREITVSQPGQYVLSVTDQFGCRGADSLTISLKQCATGFFVPDIFTPNGDHVNDIFHPNVLGNVELYSFRVYNRWGEIVFHSAQLNQGWDGKFKGLQQQADVYTWTCTFRFAGEPEEFRKGQVILAR